MRHQDKPTGYRLQMASIWLGAIALGLTFLYWVLS